ncbi:hypothetical protein NUW58_g665 [Xylaria curta]|uniref:Uncharacterized protein n=1 Tax=Xylaria curta TaxID=42375 RepID=A0ACC1PR62_9PEZI|nr:hypothetical protein NUW58_g665 [Xylaria curta]
MRASILTSLISLALLFPSFVFGTCAELSSLFPGRVLLPGNSTYAASVSSYFFLNERQAPACIVTPTSANEVAEIVKSINSHLRGLNHMETYGKDNGILSVGTGALWIDVYKFLSPLKRVAVGSRVASVGIGGFVTGGGISFFSPQHGFACDNVRNMQVVLANGTIINANATSHSLLFRALKGGQNNFGIVTRFDLVTHPQHKYWGGAIQYPESADATQLSAFTAFKEGPYDPFSEIEQTFVYVGLQKVFSSTNNLFYTKDGVNTSNLRQFTDIQPQIVNTARISESSDFAAELEAFQPMNQFATYSTISFPISGGVLSKVHSLWRIYPSTASHECPAKFAAICTEFQPT